MVKTVYKQRIKKFNTEIAKKYTDEYHLHPYIAQVLASRADTEDINAFLNPDIRNMHDPFLFADMKKAVLLIEKCIKNGKYICVCGDYDVDGICASAIIYNILKQKTNKIFVYIPERERDGYGISRNSIEKLCSLGGGLLISVDCGISEVETVEFAKQKGIDVIVTDHHSCPEILPCADAVINPKRPGETYPDKNLCGAGVAFKIACALSGKFAFNFIDLAAVATIADMVDISGENRVIVSKGLYKINVAPTQGIKALLKASNLDHKEICSEKVAFSLAPKINAAGRISSAGIAFDLLSGDETDTDKLFSIACELCNINKIRQDKQKIIFEKAESCITQEDTKSIVLFGEDWDIGVLGLAASALSKKYAVPAILFSLNNGVLTGSARSIEGINIYDCLCSCSEHLIKFGGHAQAAGLSVAVDSFDAFKKEFNKLLSENYDEDIFVTTQYYDIEGNISQIDDRFLSDMQLLAPFGIGNPAVKILFKDAAVFEKFSLCGGEHTKFTVKQKGKSLKCIAFGKTADEVPDKCDIIAAATYNDYSRNIELICEAIK